MKRFLGRVLASTVGFFIGGFLLFLILGGVIVAMVSGSEDKEPKHVSSDSILELELDGDLVERSSDNPFAKFSPFGGDRSQLGLNKLVAGLKRAQNDDKVKGIYLKCGMMGGGMASVESLRKALQEFKSKGKFILAYGETYTEKTYYIASVADKIYLYPTGEIEWDGLASTPMFLRGMLDKLEVDPLIFKVGQFKSATEMFSEKQMSEPNRLQIQTLLDDFWGHMIDGIAVSRKLDRDRLNTMAAELTIMDAKGAQKNGLIDGLWHEDEVEADLKKRLKIEGDKKLKEVDFFAYVGEKENEHSSKPKVAVIYAVGEIGMGEGDEESIGSESLSEQIREAREDDNVKAVVLRVNSPGGSALASDIIAREIELTKKVKPVIASFGDVAASGGYYISALCDSILAEPTTVTGSIGVFGMLFNTKDLFNNKLGITYDRVYSNQTQYADLGNRNRDMTEFEKAKIQRAVEDIYSDFIHIVKRGRGYPDSVAVDAIAQGRIWSGTRSVGLKLVDRTGSLSDAISIAAKKASLAEGEYQVVDLPTQVPFFEKLAKGFKTSMSSTFMEEYLTPEQVQLAKTLRSLQQPKGLYMRELMDLNID